MDIDRLSNGLRIVTEEIEHVKSLSIGVFVKSGSAIETKENNGICHLTEHVICKEFTNHASNKGVLCNGITTKEYMGFYVKSISSDKHIMVDIIAHVFDPYFSSDSFGIIKKIVKREIDEYTNNDNNIMDELLLSAHTHNHSYSFPINGTVLNLERFTLDEVMLFFKNTFVGENVVISIAGNGATECKNLLVKKNIGNNLARGSNMSPVEIAALPCNKKNNLIKYNTKSTRVKICMDGLGRCDKEKYVLQVMSAVLGGSSRSFMNTILRRGSGLSYSAYSAPIFFQQGGLLYLNIDTNADSINLVLEHMNKIFEIICKQKIDSKDLLLAQKYCIYESILKNESASAVMTQNGLYVLFNTVEQKGKELECIHSVSEEDVFRLSNKILGGGKTILIGSMFEKTGL